MNWETIKKSKRDLAVVSNMQSYLEACRTFSWQTARGELDGLPNGKGLNIAYEAVTRHAKSEIKEHPTIRWLSKKKSVEDFTYALLNKLTNSFANVLKKLGVNKGESVLVLAGRISRRLRTV